MLLYLRVKINANHFRQSLGEKNERNFPLLLEEMDFSDMTAS